MLCPKFTPFYLQLLISGQHRFSPALVANRLLKETHSPETLFQDFVLPIALNLEKRWLNGEVKSYEIFKCARRLQQLAEEIALKPLSQPDYAIKAIVGSFGAIYSGGFSLLKSVLLGTHREVIDLGTNVSPREMFTHTLGTTECRLFVTCFSLRECKQVDSLNNIFQEIGRDAPEIFIGGPVISLYGSRHKWRYPLIVLDSLSALLSRLENTMVPDYLI